MRVCSLCRRFRTGVLSLALIGWLFAGIPSALGQPVELQIAIDNVDLGGIDRIGDLSWADTLGFSWDSSFTIGGIVGRQNATIIPQIKIPFTNITIPGVTADTRTGARFSGNVAGGVGLEFYADFAASGLAAGNAFDFRPTVTLPDTLYVDEFFRLGTKTNLLANSAFTADRVHLPSFEAGMNLLFDLAVNGKVEGGLFPVIPYGSAPITMDEPWSIDQSLVKFGFDLNPGTAQAPMLTFLDGTAIEQQYSLVDPNVSSMSVELSFGPPTNRVDLGEIEIINPFGSEQTIIGGSKPNLSINTSMDDSSLGFSFETPLLRMGLDLDGIAGYLATAALGYPTSAVTRLDVELEDFASVYLELIDIKYGPEIGYREHVEIRPDFLVTLEFDNEVRIRTADGYDVVDRFTGLWSDLPEFALLGTDAVEVSVNFDALVGEQTKWASFFMTDYLQVTVLEGGLSLFDALDLSFPPLWQYRTSLLGLLGEVELDVFSRTERFAEIPLSGISTSFMLHAEFEVHVDERLMYWNSPANDTPESLDRWAPLADGVTLDTLKGKILVVGRSDGSEVRAEECLPMTLMDGGSVDGQAISAFGMHIVAGSEIRQSGSRQWELRHIHNDGLYYSDGLTEFAFGPDEVFGTTAFRGTGTMVFTDRVRISAEYVTNGWGHTLLFQGAQGSVVADRPLEVGYFLSNSGAIIFEGMTVTIESPMATHGSLLARDGSSVTLIGDQEVGGLLSASGSGSELILPFSQQIRSFQGSHGGVFEAVDGGRVSIASPRISSLDFPGNYDPTAGLSNFTFRAGEGGRLQFTGPIEQTIGSSSRFEVAAGGQMVLDGTRMGLMQGYDGGYVGHPNSLVVDALYWLGDFFPHDLRAMASQMFIVENHGTLNVYGSNKLFATVRLPEGDYDQGDPSVWRNVPPNLVNTGEIIVNEGASLIFQLWVDERSLKRMTFDQGTWTLLDGFVGVQKFGLDPDFRATDWYMAVNASNVTLSGNARFAYFNTIEENRGSLTLRNGHTFTTRGDLLNRGEIRIESGATLEMPAGRLTVDEGTLFIDGTSGASLVGASSIEIVGGTFTNQLDAGPFSLDGNWTIRERWIGADDQGHDIVLPATVSFGDAHIDQIVSSASVTLDGSDAMMIPLTGLTYNAGSLTLTGGAALAIGQNVHNADTGRINVLHGANLLINGSLTSHGELTVGPEAYLQASSLHLEAGSVILDGVIDSLQVTISDSVSVSGSTLLTGSLANSGHLAIGSSPGIMEVYGGITQSSTGAIAFEIFGQTAGTRHDQLILHADSSFEGILQLVFGEDFEPHFGRQWLLVEMRQSAEAGVPIRTVEWLFDSESIQVIGLGEFTGDFNLADFMSHRDDLLLGMYQDMAILLSFHGGTGGDLVVYSIPEPGSLLMMSLALPLVFRRRRKRIA